MRGMVLTLALALGALSGGCKKKPSLVKTPVRELAPLGGGQQLPPEEPVAAPGPIAQPAVVARPAPPTDAGVARVAAPVKPGPPSVANPYTWGEKRLPMYKQRAKFF